MVKLKCHFVYYYFLISSKVFKSCNTQQFIVQVTFYKKITSTCINLNYYYQRAIFLQFSSFNNQWFQIINLLLKKCFIWIFSVFSLFAQKHFAPQRNVLNNMVYKHFLQFCSRQINNKLNSNVHLFIACMENCNRSDLEHGSAI